MLNQTIGFVGAGQMARALAAGFVKAGLTTPQKILAADPVEASRKAFEDSVPGATIGTDNSAVANQADLVFLATKPQHAAQALASIATACRGKLLVSIAAGLTLDAIARLVPGARLMRVMPNTPCLVGASASAYALGPGATAADGELVASLLTAVGRALVVDEKLLDAVTGLSGSGPAYVYVMIEALSDGGVRMGLPRAVATTLAAQTVLGAAQMVLETGEHTAVLKDRVASPGGTTIAGLEALEAGGVRATLMSAVEAATRRSIELGQL